MNNIREILNGRRKALGVAIVISVAIGLYAGISLVFAQQSVSTASEWSDNTSDYTDVQFTSGSLQLGDYVYLIDDWEDNKYTSRDSVSTTPLNFENSYFEHVENALVRPEWGLTSGSATVDGGQVTLIGDSTDDIFGTPLYGFDNGVWKVRAKLGGDPSDYEGLDACVMFENMDERIFVFAQDSTSSNYRLQYKQGGSATQIVDNTWSVDTTSFHWFEGRKSGDNYELFLDGTSYGTGTDSYIPSNWENTTIRNNDHAENWYIEEYVIYDPDRYQPQGTWTSTTYDAGSSTNFDNIDYTASVSAGENLYWMVEAVDTGDNSGWVQDSDGTLTSSDTGAVTSGSSQNWKVHIKLETSDTSHSPSVSDYTFYTGEGTGGNATTVSNAYTSLDPFDVSTDTSIDISVEIQDDDNLGDVDNVVLKTYLSSASSTDPDAIENHYTFRWDRGSGFSEVGPGAGAHITTGSCVAANDANTLDNWKFNIQFDVSTLQIGNWNVWIQATDQG